MPRSKLERHSCSNCGHAYTWDVVIPHPTIIEPDLLKPENDCIHGKVVNEIDWDKIDKSERISIEIEIICPKCKCKDIETLIIEKDISPDYLRI